MEPRIDYEHASPQALKAMFNLQGAVNRSGLETSIQEFVKLRASQINGCAYCVDMHFKDAKAHGENLEKLNLVCVWREAPHFSERERAALLWTETLTRIADQGVPDDVFDEVRQQFSEEELVNLTLAVITINAWNRIAISFRPEVGPYQPPATVIRKEAVEQTVLS